MSTGGDSRGSLFECTLTVKKFFLMCRWNFLCSSLCLLPLVLTGSYILVIGESFFLHSNAMYKVIYSNMETEDYFFLSVPSLFHFLTFFWMRDLGQVRYLLVQKMILSIYTINLYIYFFLIRMAHFEQFRCDFYQSNYNIDNQEDYSTCDSSENLSGNRK